MKSDMRKITIYENIECIYSHFLKSNNNFTPFSSNDKITKLIFTKSK